MARIIEEKKIINSHITSYLDTITDFSKYLEGTPTFARYYSKDVTASTSDVGLGNVNQNIGNESPLKYNLIRNFPLYNMEEASISIDYDEENGTDSNIDITAIVLPDCGIRPLVGDFFACTSIKKNMELFFKINDVEIGNINDRTLYKITAHYSTPDESESAIQEQVISIYETLYDNIGQNSKAGKIVVKEDVFKNVERLKDKRDEIKDYYKLNYYNKDLNTFVYIDNSETVHYDNLLMKFIQKYNLFIENKTFLKNIYIEPLLPFDGNENKLYKSSIYNYIETEDPNKKYNKYLLDNSFHLNTKKYTVFDLYKHVYPLSKEVLHFPNKQIEDDSNKTISIITRFDYKYILDLYMNKYGLECPVCGRCDMHSHVVNSATFQALKNSYKEFNKNPEFSDYRMKYNAEERADVLVISRVNNPDSNLFTFFGPDKDKEIYLEATQPIPTDTETGTIIHKNNKLYMYVISSSNKKVLVNVEGGTSNQFEAWKIAPNNVFNNKVKYLDVLMSAILDYELDYIDMEDYIMLPIILYLINKLINEYETNI